MQRNEIAVVVQRFNRAFREHDPALLEGIVAHDCAMETIQPAPDGTRFEGGDANLAFSQALAADRVVHFEVEDTVVMGDHANVRGRLHFGDGAGAGRQPDAGPRRADRRGPGILEDTGPVGAAA